MNSNQPKSNQAKLMSTTLSSVESALHQQSPTIFNKVEDLGIRISEVISEL